MRAVCVHVVGVFEGGQYHMLRRVSVLEQLWVKAAAVVASTSGNLIPGQPDFLEQWGMVTPEPFLPDQICAGLFRRIQESFWMLV